MNGNFLALSFLKTLIIYFNALLYNTLHMDDFFFFFFCTLFKYIYYSSSIFLYIFVSLSSTTTHQTFLGFFFEDNTMLQTILLVRNVSKL